MIMCILCHQINFEATYFTFLKKQFHVEYRFYFFKKNSFLKLGKNNVLFNI